MFIFVTALLFLSLGLARAIQASSARNPEINGGAMLSSYEKQWPFSSCFRCFSNLASKLRYVDAARALFPAMPACHALPPSPTNHASRHAPLFFPPVRHDTSGPIITSPSHPQIGAQSRGAWSEIILLVPKISDDKPFFL